MAAESGVSFNIDSRAVRKMVAGIAEDQKKNIPTALNQTINKTLTKARTEADREIRKEMNLPKKDVFKNFIIWKSNKKKLWGRVIVGGRGIPLIKFGARQTRRGVAFKVKKEKGRRLLKHAFIAKMRSGHRGVFLRETKRDFSKKKHGLPIKEAITTSVVEAFSNQKTKEALIRWGESFFFPEFERNLVRLIKRRPKNVK